MADEAGAATVIEWNGTGPDPDEATPHDVGELVHESPPLAERPVVRIVAGELTRMIRETIHALGEGDENLYQRAGQLVRIVREPERREPYERDRCVGLDILTRPGTPRMRDASGVLLERVDSVSRWERFDARRGERPKAEGGGRGGKGAGEWVPANPDGVVVNAIAKRGDWPGIRPIRGILETPCLAPGHRLIVQPGYDEETGFVLLPSCKVGNILDLPTREHARAAMQHLWIETSCDLPFRDVGERSPADVDGELQFLRAREVPDAFVTVAALLTIFARLAIDGAVPGAMFEAAGQGSGKSLQMHVVSMIATSRSAGVATFPMRDGRPNEEECEKILAGYAMAGARIVAFDNIRGLLAGGCLEKALTAVDNIDLRVLGQNHQLSLPWSALLLFSGNNMMMSDDVAQRVMISRLESEREDPRSRPRESFRHPALLNWIKANRSRLVRAVLVILRSYLAAQAAGLDVPDPGCRGSFEAWSAIVPGALMWAGGPNVLHAFPEAGRGGDEEGEAHGVMLRGWQNAWQKQKASTILDHLYPESERDQHAGKAPPDGLDEVRAAVRSLTRAREGQRPSAHDFGMRMWRLRGKIRDGLRLDAVDDKATKTRLYSVHQVRR